MLEKLINCYTSYRWQPKTLRLEIAFGLAMVLGAPSSYAINGYFMNGYGAKAVGVAGVGVAMPQDTMAVSSNPAGMAFVEPGFDAYVRMMHPQRWAEHDCTGIGACTGPVKDRSAREFFVVPGFGYSKRYSDRLNLGFALYANGGINTSYSKAFYDGVAARIAGATTTTPGFPDQAKLGVDYSQLIFAPNLAFRVTDRMVVGIAPLIAMHKFSARGFESFGAFSTDPASISNRGSDYGVGGGVKIGIIYELTDKFRVGAQYNSKLYMPKMTKYSGLFPNGGELDAPAHYSVGFSTDVSSHLTFGIEYQVIRYADVAAFGNSGPTRSEFTTGFTQNRLFGGADGMGFGWENQSVWKVGGIYKFSDRLSFRLGWNRGSSIVPPDQALFAIAAPGMLSHHIHGGMSFKLSNGAELSWGYMHAFKESITDGNSPFFGTRVTTTGRGDALDISYSRRY